MKKYKVEIEYNFNDELCGIMFTGTFYNKPDMDKWMEYMTINYLYDDLMKFGGLGSINHAKDKLTLFAGQGNGTIVINVCESDM